MKLNSSCKRVYEITYTSVAFEFVRGIQKFKFCNIDVFLKLEEVEVDSLPPVGEIEPFFVKVNQKLNK